MSNEEEPKVEKQTPGEPDATEPVEGESCDAIGDPVRKTLCKICGLPVVGLAPFCKDHEPPVP